MSRRYYKKGRKKRKNKYSKIEVTGIAIKLAMIAAFVYLILNGFTVTIGDIKRLLGPFTGVTIGVLLLIIMCKIYKKHKYLNSDMYRVDRMNGKEFEEFLKCFFEENGYRVKLTPGSGDYGVDLICTKTVPGTHKEKESVAIQAKRYKGKVGIAAVQQIIGGMHYYNCEKGMVITNSIFTDNARNLADKSNVVLWDRWVLKKELEKMKHK